MIDGREPNYICLDTRAIRLVMRLSEPERLLFFDSFFSLYDDKLSGSISTFPDNIVGDLLKQAAETMSNGFDAYMGRANANPDGKNGRKSMTGHRHDNDIQSNQDQTNRYQTIPDQINQTKQQLLAEGFEEAEIVNALNRSKGKHVRDLTAYIRQAIENQRQQKRVPAQDFQQRSYDGVQEEQINNLAREIEEAKAEGII